MCGDVDKYVLDIHIMYVHYMYDCIAFMLFAINANRAGWIDEHLFDEL